MQDLVTYVKEQVLLERLLLLGSFTYKNKLVVYVLYYTQ